MNEIILYYVIPNIVMFSSLYAMAKGIEWVTWQTILFVNDPNDETNHINKALGMFFEF